MIVVEERELSQNLMEEVVETYLDGFISLYGACKCKQCRADIKAVTLNNLSPRYIVTTKSDAYVRVSAMSNQEQADILAAATKAIEIVTKSPRH